MPAHRVTTRLGAGQAVIVCAACGWSRIIPQLIASRPMRTRAELAELADRAALQHVAPGRFGRFLTAGG
jgi:hypothetical protein